MTGGKKKKIRIELEDAEGDKYNLSIEGNISKEKLMKAVEFMDLLNIEQKGDGPLEKKIIPASVGAKIWELVETSFPYSAFTSSDVLELYEDHYNEPIKLSTVSTYLSRYSDRGKLTRNRQGKEWIYKKSRQPLAPAQSLEPQANHRHPAVPYLNSEIKSSTAFDLRQ